MCENERKPWENEEYKWLDRFIFTVIIFFYPVMFFLKWLKIY